MIKKILILLILLLNFNTVQALTVNQKNYQNLVKAFIKKDRATVEKLAKKLKNYILYPYVEYYVVNDLQLKNKAAINQFLKKHGNRAIAIRLKSKWLNWLIRNKHYHSAAQYTVARWAYETRCNVLTAKIKLGQTPNYLKNKDLWLYGKSRPDACNVAFKFWKRNNSIGMHNYSQRTLLALKANNLKFAKRLALKSSKPVQAKVWLAKLRRKALYRAKDFPKNGYQLLDRLPDSVVNDEVRAWKVRQRIHYRNWKLVLSEINAMPKIQRQKDIWQYWHSRALARIGDRLGAIKGYRTLANRTNYYGFLSADRLSLPYNICNQQKKVDSKKMLQKFPSLQRSFELYRLNSLVFAGMEWNSAIRKMTRDQKIDAAIIAAEKGWYPKAIYTLGRLRKFDYYGLRFPLKWQDSVKKNAKLRNLSPAYVYGIMRTESSMNPDALSRVGAIGLMQLMPETAKRVGKRYGLKNYQKSDLLQPENNIKFGSAYLHQMAKKWSGQFILMTASYNAGPGKVKKWVNKFPIEADIFIESIPYDETRKYVTRVLDYTTMYNWKMYDTVRRIGYRISNIGYQKAFIPSKDTYTKIVCNAD